MHSVAQHARTHALAPLNATLLWALILPMMTPCCSHGARIKETTYNAIHHAMLFLEERRVLHVQWHRVGIPLWPGAEWWGAQWRIDAIANGSPRARSASTCMHALKGVAPWQLR